jgi:hypothetical protein|tara:strand:- start:265 stop:606 length:342 start_codon:yes stop_codon:yes gene_type:complete
MKWIGQNIYDLISRFRNDIHINKKVYDENSSAGLAGQQLTSTTTGVVWTDQTFTHNQGGASTTWNVTHNLNKYPSVTIVTSTNVVIIGNVAYNSVNQLTITLANADSGKAYLN